MTSIKILQNILEEKVLKLDYFNESFTRIMSLSPVIKNFNYEISNNIVNVEFELNSNYKYQKQSSKLRLFTYKENDKKLGFTIEQIQEDILNNVVAYFGINEEDNDIIKFINLLEVNENMFAKHGFDKRTRIRSVPNTINKKTDSDMLEWAYCYCALYLAENINLTKISASEFSNKHQKFLTEISKQYNILENDNNLYAFTYLEGDILGKNDDNNIDEARYNSVLVQINKNNHIFAKYGVYCAFAKKSNLLLNHRQLFDAKFIFLQNKINFPQKSFTLNQENIDLGSYESLVLPTRDEVFNFNEDIQSLIMKLNDVMSGAKAIINSFASTNRLVQRKALKTLDIFEDEDVILELLEEFYNWFKTNENVLSYLQNNNLDSIKNILDNIENYLIESGDYVKLDIKKIAKQFNNSFVYYDIDKVIDVICEDMTLNEENHENVRIYLGNFMAINDIIRNMYKILQVKLIEE